MVGYWGCGHCAMSSSTVSKLPDDEVALSAGSIPDSPTPANSVSETPSAVVSTSPSWNGSVGRMFGIPTAGPLGLGESTGHGSARAIPCMPTLIATTSSSERKAFAIYHPTSISDPMCALGRPGPALGSSARPLRQAQEEQPVYQIRNGRITNV